MATLAQVDEFRTANQSLVALAQRDLAAFWESLNLLGDPIRVRDLLLEFFPDLLQSYGDVAAVLGADWYDALRTAPPSAAAFTAALARPTATAQAVAAARWALGPLFETEPDPVAALDRLMGTTQRLVMQPGRDTVIDSAVRDPARMRFARMPSGATTCRWCVMLASRGFEYTSAEAAGDGRRFHDHCDCVVVPGRGPDDLPEGYDLAGYKSLYADHSGVGRDEPTE